MENDPDLKELLPQLNMNVSNQPTTQKEEEKPNLISDELYLGMCGEVLDMLRKDREEASKYIDDFADMVVNGGDPSPASKEALVNLIKIKSDIPDKMSKVLDFMTRVKLKEKDTFPRYLAAHQNNTINIGDSNKREFLKKIQQHQKKKDTNG